MKLHLKQHIPNFVSGSEPVCSSVDSWGSARKLKWLHAWEDEHFHHWEEARDYPGDGTTLLMAITKDGKHWVAAYVTGGPLPLPEWKHTK